MTGDSKIFFKSFDNEFKDKFETEGITYEHRLIDDMVAAAEMERILFGPVKIMMETYNRYGRTRFWLFGSDDLYPITPDGEIMDRSGME